MSAVPVHLPGYLLLRYRIFLITDLILYFFIINDITDHDFILVSADSVVVHILIGCIDRTRIRSVPTECFAPNFNASIPRIPLPHPTSKISVSSVTYFLSWRMQSCVVSCIPVPNAVPGSIWITILSLSLASTFSP